MVEKIIINPNKVRGYGNIMSPHSISDYSLEDCTIATGTDTVNGATETVYTLTSTASHSYSLSFGSASYTAVGGACTVTVTLTDGGVAVNNASISVTGGTGGSGTGTTNSSGVATINVTGITANGTLTASFSGATATASIIYSSIPYQTVEYLQSNGSQYINTGYTLQSSDKVEVSVSMQGSGTYNGVFGARKGSSSTNCYALFGRFGSANKFCYARTGNEKQGSTIQINTVYDVTTTGSTCTVKQGSTTVETITSTGTINGCANPCGLFIINTDSGTGFTKDTYGYMKIYSFKITNSSNEVVMDLVPVRDGTTGYMYDTVSEELMTNTGTFLYGSDI